VKSTQVSASRKEQPSRDSIERKVQGVEAGRIAPTDKWKALVEYDNEIRAAAEKVRPYGQAWVDKLGHDFFALDQDRQYLPNIVARLTEEAETAEVEREMKLFRYTSDGETCTEESLGVLREAKGQGFMLDVDRRGTFELTKNSSTTYLRSNADIQWFAGAIMRRPKAEPAAPTVQATDARKWGNEWKKVEPSLQNGKWRFEGSKLVCNYELSELRPPQTPSSLRIECAVSRWDDGVLATYLDFYLAPYLYLIPDEEPFEAHLVKASFVLGTGSRRVGKGDRSVSLGSRRYVRGECIRQ